MVGTRGRPRSEQAKRAVLDTALRLCERDGYQQLTIKAIADEAGVGRQTVYRWWSDKAEILMDALIDRRERELPKLVQETGDTLRDVESVLVHTFQLTRGRPVPKEKRVRFVSEFPPPVSFTYANAGNVQPRPEDVVWNQRGLGYNGHFPLDLIVDPPSDMP